MKTRKRVRNEKAFPNWVELSTGGRRYWYEILGRHGWKARYVKETGAGETTTRFYQEIYDEHGSLVEVHQKYPVDTGHQKV